MKRRGFFGLVAGAAVAGPSIAKQAIGGMGLDALSISNAGTTLGSSIGVGYASGQATTKDVMGGFGQIAHAQDTLKKLVGMSASDRARHKKRMHVGQLDPDIAAYRSIALHAKIDWQRERQLSVLLDERKTFWSRMAEGLGYTEEDYLP